jgi:hypothetical protein
LPLDYTTHVARPCEITADDLHDAYVFCRLRRLGIGYVKAIETPAILIALRNTLKAMKRKQNGNPAPQQRELITGE